MNATPSRDGPAAGGSGRAAGVDIVLCTLNARQVHASLGLRCLRANLEELAAGTVLEEASLAAEPRDVAERILRHRPRIVGFGVYVWNVEATARVAGILRALEPDLTLVFGGPEVSHPPDLPAMAALADHIVTGPGEVAFRQLARVLLHGGPAPARLLCAPAPPAMLCQPFAEYDARDLAQRFIYVEASRGCPYRCSFCLSALDRRVEYFDETGLFAGLEGLLAAGGRRIRFVDRTFNLDLKRAGRILDFFLERGPEGLELHFELVPDRLPETLLERLACFPAGVLRLEVGIQSLDAGVQARIRRRQDRAQALASLDRLRRHTGAILHADLLFGLPEQDMAVIADDFDALVAVGPHEIQPGILKRLRGAPICAEEGLVFDPAPPYPVLATPWLSFDALSRLRRLARYWEIFANHGVFGHSLPLLLGDRPFARFMAFSEALGEAGVGTCGISQPRQFQLLAGHLGNTPGARAALTEDWRATGAGRLPGFLRPD